MIGRTLGGGYLILDTIGVGGMGRVYRASHASLGRELAVKVIHPHLAADDGSVARFYAEARACSKLNHPNVVNVLDFGRTDDGLLFLVMEFMRGADLARVIESARALPPRRAMDIVRQVLAALSEAHDVGVVHRDIKPENIIVDVLRTGKDFVTVVDFGIAKIHRDSSPGVTRAGLVLGTPEFMAPEQILGQPVDPRIDLYAAAVVLYNALTGRLPFEADSYLDVLKMQLQSPPPDPRTFVPELPGALVDVLFRALCKDPDGRFQTAAEFARALQECVTSPSFEGLAARIQCPECRAPAPLELKFCGECGARLRPSIPSRGVGHASLGELPFVGRDAALSLVARARRRAAAGAVTSVRVVGEEGSGRRRLLRAAAETARREGAAFFRVGSEPEDAPYGAAGRLLRALLDLAPGEAARWAEADGAGDDPVARAGYREVFTESGADGLDAGARAEAVVHAALHALGRAVQRTPGRPVCIAFERVDHADEASLRLIASLHARAVQTPVFLATTHGPEFRPPWEGSERVTLQGLDHEAATAALSAVQARVPSDTPVVLPAGAVMPLHLEQLARWRLEGGGEAPVKTVDLVAARAGRLSPDASRTLQALAVLNEAGPQLLESVSGVPCLAPLRDELASRGWITSTGPSGREVLGWSHPLLREVIGAATPLALRAEMHRAAHREGGGQMSLKARAMHALRGEETASCLALLERVGDRALARGDCVTAMRALRRGLEAARRELVRGDNDDAAQTIVRFALKLGEALNGTGQFSHSEGVLREGLDVARSGSPERLRIDGALGRALFGRGRRDDGLRLVEATASAAWLAGQRILAAELLVLRQALEPDEGSPAHAARSLALAASLALTAVGEGTARQRIEVLLGVARARRLMGLDDPDALDAARALAQGDLAAAARCEAETAERVEAAGAGAAAAWRRAARAAWEAGDAPMSQACEARTGHADALS